MNYVELTFKVADAGYHDVIIAKLADIGFESFVENETGIIAYIAEQHYNPQEVNDLLHYYEPQFKIEYQQKIIPHQNWNAQWESSFNPILVDGKCYVRAPFHGKNSDFLYDVVIEPKMSFGTGHHETTQLMISYLLTLPLQSKTVLDMGCGTGVLAIVASMAGAGHIDAVDVDEWSYENTKENIQRNNTLNIDVYKGDERIVQGKKYDIILANINKNILLKNINAYSNLLNTNGDILLSGFFITDVDELKGRCSEAGLHYITMLTKNQWAMLHFNKY